MAKTKEISPKKQARLQVTDQLLKALPGLEDSLGKKEFNERIKKAVKLLTAGVKIKAAKKAKIKAEKAA